MLIKDIKDQKYFRSADGCILCELLHRKNEDFDLKAGYSIAHAVVPAYEKTVPHRLKESSEVYYILSGKGIMHIDGEEAEVYPGQAVYIPPGAVQYIENSGDSDLIFLAIADPEWSEADEEISENA
ncbi:cupin domain-containing protein [Methanoplanus endosymbiosus]|uniref:Cupin domain-containing protein n=1 Tax=Methanoplanus endosymbiosus TaxID=33865 RepID=A0A9E7PLT9_9EURY|nr:cupin domain-containing protein [Methanoplanus endosymbiosus]UUX91329.1 cupin domain-containing protein [Methanoplanus endosymbiosus]